MVEATCQDTLPPATLGGHLAVLAALPLLSAVLAASPGVVAPPSPPDCEAAPQPLVLAAESRAPPVLCLSPGTATTLLFDTPLAPGAVEVQATEQELRLAQGPAVVTLVPSARLLAGEWRKLTVRFGDGAAPAVATVLLYVHPARATRQVEVQRKPRTVESYQLEVAEREEQLRQCQQENAQLRAAQGQPEGLRGLVSAGLMGDIDRSGVTVENLSLPPRRYTVRKGSALEATRVWSYRSSTRLAVELRLTLLSGEQPWVAEGATLVDAHGREVPVLPLWQAAPVALGKFQSVVVEAEATAKEAQGPYTLNLWDMGGARSVTVRGVVFPPAPGSTAR